MIKKILFIAAIVAVFVSCNQKNEQGTPVSIDEFEMKAPDLVGQMVTIEGTVSHVCREDGKRMFLIDKNPDMSIKIVPGDNMPSFDVAMEGSEVAVTGVVAEDFAIDKNYLDEWEADVRKQAAEAMAEDSMQTEEESMESDTMNKKVAGTESTEGHEDAMQTTVEGGDGAGHGDHHLTGLEKVEKWRKKLADSGKDQLMVYMVKATKIEEKKK